MLFDLPKQILRDLSEALQKTADNALSESQLRSILENGLRKCNLVTREEFDAQQAVLLRTREKLDALEAQLAQFEKDRLDNKES